MPYDRLNEVGRLRDYLKVMAEEYLGDGVRFTVRGRLQDLERLRPPLTGARPDRRSRISDG